MAALSGSSPTRLFASTDTGFLVLTLADGGVRSSVELPGQAVLCAVALADGTLLAGVDGGLLIRSPDAAGWTEVEGPPSGTRVTALEAGPAGRKGDPPVLWAGTEPSRVYDSHDGGRTWRPRPGLEGLESADEWSFPPRPDTHHVRTFAAHPGDPDRLLVGIEAGAVVSTEDGGSSWADRRPAGPYDPHAMRTHPDAPGLVRVAAGDGWIESDDHGRTWRRPAQPPLGYLWDVALDAADPERALIVAAEGAGAAHGHGRPSSALFLREGAGPWRQVGRELGLDTRRTPSVAALPDVPGGFALLTREMELHLSVDGGHSWNPLPLAWPGGAAVPDHVSGLIAQPLSAARR